MMSAMSIEGHELCHPGLLAGHSALKEPIKGRAVAPWVARVRFGAPAHHLPGHRPRPLGRLFGDRNERSFSSEEDFWVEAMAQCNRSPQLGKRGRSTCDVSRQ